MKLINRINIKFKLGILFSILCISIAILAYKSINIGEHNKQTLKEVHSKSQAVLSLQDSIITPLYKLRELTQTLVMAPNKELRENIENDLNRLVIQLDKEFIVLEDKSLILNQWINYKRLINNTKGYLKEEFEEGAYINVTTSSREQFNSLLSELLDIQSKFLNNSTVAYEKASTEAKNIKLEVFTIIVIVLILAIIIGWLITSNIISSIHKVHQGLSNFFDYLNHKKKEVSIKLK